MIVSRKYKNNHISTYYQRTCGHKFKIQQHLQSLKELKYLGVNLTKHIYDLCAENYKTLTKVLKDLNKLIHGLENIFRDSKTQHRTDTDSPQTDTQV